MQTMKHKHLINFKALSIEITGSARKIRSTNTANIYNEPLTDLDELLNAWINCTKRRLKGKQQGKYKAFVFQFSLYQTVTFKNCDHKRNTDKNS